MPGYRSEQFLVLKTVAHFRWFAVGYRVGQTT
jgi:hypothetical protein